MITGYLITVFGNVKVHNVTIPLSFVDMTSLQAAPNWGVKEAVAERASSIECVVMAQVSPNWDFVSSIEAAIGLTGLSRTLPLLSPILARSIVGVLILESSPFPFYASILHRGQRS